MNKRYDLGELEWSLAGWTPYVWAQQRSIESGVSLNAEVPHVPATVPGSVQGALREAGLLPDWNVGLNARLCEWVENRHWIYTARLPDAWLQHRRLTLEALGLDYSGWILLNGQEVARFTGSLRPHEVDLTAYLRPEGNTLQLVFDCPPRWLGQIGYTSEMREWKPRFNYFWDWTSRLVQIGIWDDLTLVGSEGAELGDLWLCPEADLQGGGGRLRLQGEVRAEGGLVQAVLEQAGQVLRREQLSLADFRQGVCWEGLPVEWWWPNGAGAQPLYTLHVELLDAAGQVQAETSQRIGFTSIKWERCEGAPAEADPWLCVVNGRPIFLQGVNWTPILPNFADVGAPQYRSLLETYRDLGCNTLRVWGGAFLERQIFYDLCDELGLLVWQEFPLSSSGLDNWPPEDDTAVEEMAEIAASYLRRRRNHVCVLAWCGGNELQGPTDDPTRRYRPATAQHAMLARLGRVVAELDPGRRYLVTSPSGPRFGGEPDRFGTGQHWDVHGPWHISGRIDQEWAAYWAADDAFFRSEVGVSSASDAEVIRRYAGGLPEVPGTRENPLWRRTSWWIEWPVFIEEQGREPDSLEEYVAWSQERQRRALAIAARACKERFPRCGGFLLWMGHDSFPCTANTAIIDFHGNLKPAAHELGRIYRGDAVGEQPEAQTELVG